MHTGVERQRKSPCILDAPGRDRAYAYLLVDARNRGVMGMQTYPVRWPLPWAQVSSSGAEERRRLDLLQRLQGGSCWNGVSSWGFAGASTQLSFS